MASSAHPSVARSSSASAGGCRVQKSAPRHGWWAASRRCRRRRHAGCRPRLARCRRRDRSGGSPQFRRRQRSTSAAVRRGSPARGRPPTVAAPAAQASSGSWERPRSSAARRGSTGCHEAAILPPAWAAHLTRPRLSWAWPARSAGQERRRRRVRVHGAPATPLLVQAARRTSWGAYDRSRACAHATAFRTHQRRMRALAPPGSVADQAPRRRS